MSALKFIEDLSMNELTVEENEYKKFVKDYEETYRMLLAEKHLQNKDSKDEGARSSTASPSLIEKSINMLGRFFSDSPSPKQSSERKGQNILECSFTQTNFSR
jgi:hypothetical protein